MLGRCVAIILLLTAWTHGAPPQFDITKNIQTDYSAQCKGDYTSTTLTVTWTAFATTITVFSNTFSSADIGKTIFVAGAGDSVNEYAFSVITAVGSFSGGQQTLTVNTNPSRTTVTAAAKVVAWGTDDTAAFAAFNAFGQAQGASTILLNWPSAPSTCQILDPTSTAGSNFSDGIQNLTVDFQSGTLSAPYPGTSARQGAVYNLGSANPVCQHGLTDAAGCSARLNTVSAGATSVFLTSASLAAGYISRFTVGNWMMVTGLDTQGFGFPLNPYYYDFVKITAINVVTGQIDFDRALTNTYLSTWPVYDIGDAFHADQGGAASAYGLLGSFQTVVEYRNGSLYMANQQTNALGYSVTFRNITIIPTGSGDREKCPYPSRNVIWAVYNSDFSFCTIEVDKTVDRMIFSNSLVYILHNQSASPNLLTTTNVTFGSGMTGTPKNWFDTGSTVPSILAGVTSYGYATEINLTNTSFGSIVMASATYRGGVGDPGVSPTWAMTSGKITILNTEGAQPWAVPGANFFWWGTAYIGTARVTAVTQDATNTYIQTNLAGSYPAFNSALLKSGTKLDLIVHPAPKFTCSGCVGSEQAINLNSATAAAPLFSYYKFLFDGSVNGPWPPLSGSQAGIPVFGNLVSATYNVTKAYTGVSGALTLSPTRNDIYTTVVPSTLTVFSYIPGINLRASPHTVTTTCVSAVSCSTTGNVAGDTPNTPTENIYFTGDTSPVISANISAESSSLWPSATVTIVTDQGVVLP